MTDRYGDVTFPAALPVRGEAAGDRPSTLIVDFATAVLNASIAAPWGDVCPSKRPAESRFPWNPDVMFQDKALPAIYGWRDGGDKMTWTAAEWRTRNDYFHLRWVFPLQQQVVARLRAPIIAALTSALDRAIFDTRHPAYVHPDDTDLWAPTFVVEPAVILKPKATSTSPHTFSGAGLDGAKAGQPIPRRGAIIDLAGPQASWTDGSTVTLTGKDVMGNTTSHALRVERARIPYRLFTTAALTEITAVGLGAQAGTAGTIAVGLGPRRGYGTSLVDFGHLDVEMVQTARWAPVTIDFKHSKERRVYPAVGWKLRLFERLVRDPAEYPEIGAGIDTLGNAATVPGAEVQIQPVDGQPVDGSFP